MKKFLMILLAAVMLLCPLSAFAQSVQSEPAQPVYLDSTTIIDGDLLYYSGSIDGGEIGVYVMNADGSDPKKLSDISAELLAISDSNLLVYHYDMDTGDASLAVLKPDGELTMLDASYGGSAIAAQGRFFWGSGSCAADGSDVQIYFDLLTTNYYDYYPLTVYGDCLYYLDWSEVSDVVYNEGYSQPMGAKLCRINLNDRSIEVISGAGTRYVGLENNTVYYTRDNYWCESEDGYTSYECKVDEGLFCADLDTLAEKRLASYPEKEEVVDSYTMIEDGVIYGTHSDYSVEDNFDFRIIRIQTDGTRLEDLTMDSGSWATLSAVADGILYITESTITTTEDDFIQLDRIIAIDSETMEQTVLNPESLDMLFYSESDPAVCVAGERIYYTSYDMERWSVCLKCMNLDGSDVKLIAHGYSFAEG